MKVAILTNFMEFNPGYSLTGIVQDQITMLRKYGHEVHLYVNERYHGEAPVPTELNVTIHETIPFTHLKDYSSINQVTDEHREIAKEMAKRLKYDIDKYDYDIIFTHDFVFTGWFLPYGMGCMALKDLSVKWLHWIHSIPSANRDWWNMNLYGDNAKIVYPNETDAIRAAEQYKTITAKIAVIPHIKDLRTWMEFGRGTNEFIDAFPKLMQADFIQILPASSDRLSAKRVNIVIQIFAYLKRAGFSVCLCVANQWATGRQRREGLDRYTHLASQVGLDGSEFFFTSTFKEKYETGIPRKILRELMMLSNLFIFPTREESFGLVVPEAALTSGALLVLNKSLQMQVEVAGGKALYFNFGSYHAGFRADNVDKYYEDIAFIIANEFKNSKTLTTKWFCRKTYNMDSLYNRVYAPTMKQMIEGC